jgi:hypothetical protein
MAAVTVGSSTKPMFKKVKKILTTNIASLTTCSTDLQSSFNSVVHTWYMTTVKQILRSMFSGFSPRLF